MSYEIVERQTETESMNCETVNSFSMEIEDKNNIIFSSSLSTLNLIENYLWLFRDEKNKHMC